MEKIEEEQVKFGREPVKEEVNDIHSSHLKNLPSEQHGSNYDPADPNAEERQQQLQVEALDIIRQEDERAAKFKENAFLQTLKAQKKKPPSEQDSLKGWIEPDGPGREGYHRGTKKGWDDTPKVMNLPGRGRVVVHNY